MYDKKMIIEINTNTSSLCVTKIITTPKRLYPGNILCRHHYQLKSHERNFETVIRVLIPFDPTSLSIPPENIRKPLNIWLSNVLGKAERNLWHEMWCTLFYKQLNFWLLLQKCRANLGNCPNFQFFITGTLRRIP